MLTKNALLSICIDETGTSDYAKLSQKERDLFLPCAFLGSHEVMVLALCEYKYPPLLDRLAELFGPDTRIAGVPGFRFDGTSNPRITRPIIPQFDPYLWATMLHDIAYCTELFDVNGEGDYGQAEADYWYRELLKHYGLRNFASNTRYLAVRSFGWIKHPHDIETIAFERSKHRYHGNPWGGPY